MEALRKLKAKFSTRNRVKSLTVEFSDFFICDQFFYFLGVSYLKPNVQRWRQFHLVVSLVFGLLLMILCAINVGFTNVEANFWELIESTRIIAVFAIILCIWISLEFRHRDKILKVLQQLIEFYPRSYVEQDEIKAKEYAAKIKKFFKISLFLDFLLL